MQTSSAVVDHERANSGISYTTYISSKKNQLQDYDKASVACLDSTNNEYNSLYSLAKDHKYNVIEGVCM